MYEPIKKLVKKIVPASYLFRNELAFRKFLIPFYSGKKFTCNVCSYSWKTFIHLPDGDLLCPYCSSRSRTRRLLQLLQKEKFTGKVLHFSPSRSLFRRLKKDGSITYFSTDFENEFLADFKFDITNIQTTSNSFDFVLCYHILEHIEDDKKAMQELYRVLKKDGKCFVQTPFKEGEIYEDKNIVSKKERLREFGQEDHVRIYSVEGLRKRLEDVGFTVEILHFKDAIHPLGLKEEFIFRLKK